LHCVTLHRQPQEAGAAARPSPRQRAHRTRCATLHWLFGPHLGQLACQPGRHIRVLRVALWVNGRPRKCQGNHGTLGGRCSPTPVSRSPAYRMARARAIFAISLSRRRSGARDGSDDQDSTRGHPYACVLVEEHGSCWPWITSLRGRRYARPATPRIFAWRLENFQVSGRD
jgi:hypothetical protein